MMNLPSILANSQSSVVDEIAREFKIHPALFLSQAVNLLALFLALILAILAVRVIFKRARGWEVPVWLVLVVFIPVIFPIFALIHFKKSRIESV